ncbi:hypothetical protein VTI74DRAFT_1243 [Chaetomium olivicolor]
MDDLADWETYLKRGHERVHFQKEQGWRSVIDEQAKLAEAEAISTLFNAFFNAFNLSVRNWTDRVPHIAKRIQTDTDESQAERLCQYIPQENVMANNILHVFIDRIKKDPRYQHRAPVEVIIVDSDDEPMNDANDNGPGEGMALNQNGEAGRGRAAQNTPQASH